MEDSKASSLQQQQQKQMTQQQQQMTQQMTQQQQQHLQQQQQQLLLFQQLQRQKQQQQQDAMSRFPSNIDVHLRPQSFLHRPINPQSQTPNPTNPKMPNQLASPPQGQQRHQPNPTNHLAVNSFTNSNPSNTSNSNQHQQQQDQQAKVARANPAELQLAYQDAWRVCHPDFKRPFSSLEDACERLLPYHVVADYEAEEDDKILDSDTTGQMLSRSQQWDHNIAAKVAEFTATFEKQVLAFNIISRKRALGEFRTEEKLMLEQLMLQEEKRALFELRSEMDSRQKMGRDNHEANMRMVRARAEQASGEPIRANAYGSQVSNVQGQEGNHGEMNNGWGSNQPNNDKELSEDFLNDEETENGDTGTESEWRAGGELDLNAR